VTTTAEDRRSSVSQTTDRPGPPRIAFVLSQFPETHETFILREFVALDEAGLDFVILSLKPCRDRVIQKDAGRFLGRTYYPWRLPRGIPSAAGSPGREAARLLPWGRRTPKSLYVWWAARRFANLVAALGVARVHAHWATAPASTAALISTHAKVPYSFTAHAWDIFAGDGRLEEKARAADFIITCTNANVAAIRSMIAPEDAAKVILNYHGIPRARLGRRSSARNGALRIAAVGRLVPTKGFTHLLAALAGAGFPFDLVIAGDGPLRRRLEKQARVIGAGRVTFAGMVNNEEVFEILRSSDVLVMPSVISPDGDRDGIPNVVLEAMAVGLPVVASGISGLPEAVVDGETGIITVPGSPDAIRAALRRIRDNRAEAESMGARGRRHVAENFRAEANAAALFDIFARQTRAAER
jgi:glycosyltransferase involved in cell wall biosynthesis